MRDIEKLCGILRNSDDDILKIVYSSVSAEVNKRGMSNINIPSTKAVRNSRYFSVKGGRVLVYEPWKYKQSCYSIPEDALLHQRLDYYKHIVYGQKWSHLFTGSSDKNYYVYAHINPLLKCDVDGYDGLPFYVGKGTGNRIDIIERNEFHNRYYNRLVDRGFSKSSLVVKLFENLDEAEALEIESKLMYLFGNICEATKYGTCLTNMNKGAVPKFKRTIYAINKNGSFVACKHNEDFMVDDVKKTIFTA